MNFVGNTPSALLRMNYASLTDAIMANLQSVTNGLYTKELIPMDTVNHIQTAKGISDLLKSGQLVSILQMLLNASPSPYQYLIDVCHVLINQQHRTLTEIATSILHQLGECLHELPTIIIYVIFITHWRVLCEVYEH